MKIHNTPIEGLLVIDATIFEDERGYFFESFRVSALEEYLPGIKFLQDNESKSNTGVVRGLHLQQPPFGQGKLIRVVTGRILDVAVDIRKNSPTYGQHFSIELSGKNKKSFFIPEGFAHGFSCLENHTIVQYRCTNYYNKASELGIAWNDPILNIDWQIDEPIISEKDQLNTSFSKFNSPY